MFPGWIAGQKAGSDLRGIWSPYFLQITPCPTKVKSGEIPGMNDEWHEHWIRTSLENCLETALLRPTVLAQFFYVSLEEKSGAWDILKNGLKTEHGGLVHWAVSDTIVWPRSVSDRSSMTSISHRVHISSLAAIISTRLRGENIKVKSKPSNGTRFVCRQQSLLVGLKFVSSV